MSPLVGKTVLITGGAQGIGAAVDPDAWRTVIDLVGVFHTVRATLPAPVSEPIGVATAAAAITSGIARRARRVYAPRWVPILLDLRVPLVLGDRLLAVWPRMRRIVRDTELAVRA